MTENIRGKYRVVPERLCEQIAAQLYDYGSGCVVNRTQMPHISHALRSQLFAIPLSTKCACASGTLSEAHGVPSSGTITDAPDAERALLEQKVIEEAKRVVSIVQPQYVGSIEYTLKTHLDALDAHILAKTAKPKRVPGWYWANFTGHKDGKGRCPIHYDGKTFAFFEFSHGFGDKAETEFDWVSDTPLDLKREERACSKGYFERKE